MPGAINVPVEDLTKRMRNFPKGREVIAYCRGPYCLLSVDALALLRTKGFKARAPNMKVVDFWDAEQKKMMHYIPDPANPGKMLVETRIDQTSARGLPIKQPEAAWQAIFNEFKTST